MLHPFLTMFLLVALMLWSGSRDGLKNRQRLVMRAEDTAAERAMLRAECEHRIVLHEHPRRSGGGAEHRMAA